MSSTGSSLDFGTIQTPSTVKETKVRQKQARKAKLPKNSNKKKRIKTGKEEQWPSSPKISPKKGNQLRSKPRQMPLLSRRASSTEESSKFWSTLTSW